MFEEKTASAAAAKTREDADELCKKEKKLGGDGAILAATGDLSPQEDDRVAGEWVVWVGGNSGKVEVGHRHAMKGVWDVVDPLVVRVGYVPVK